MYSHPRGEAFAYELIPYQQRGETWRPIETLELGMGREVV